MLQSTGSQRVGHDLATEQPKQLTSGTFSTCILQIKSVKLREIKQLARDHTDRNGAQSGGQAVGCRASLAMRSVPDGGQKLPCKGNQE